MVSTKSSNASFQYKQQHSTMFRKVLVTLDQAAKGWFAEPHTIPYSKSLTAMLFWMVPAASHPKNNKQKVGCQAIVSSNTET